jgi:hypothetical protein
MTATSPTTFLPVGFIYRVLSKAQPHKSRASTHRLRKSDSTSEIIRQLWTPCRRESMQVTPAGARACAKVLEAAAHCSHAGRRLWRKSDGRVLAPNVSQTARWPWITCQLQDRSSETRFSSPTQEPELPSRLRNAAKAWVLAQDQITRAEGCHFEIGTITGDEKPMTDLVTQNLNRTNRWEVLT